MSSDFSLNATCSYQCQSVELISGFIMIEFFKKVFWRKKRDQLYKKILPPNYKKMPKWKVALYICMYAAIVFVFFLAIAFAWFAKDLPTPTKIANRRAVDSTKLYDRTGQVLLYETGDQKRTVVEGSQISQYLKDSTIATEDANFYKHHGFDTKSLFRAVYAKMTGKTTRVSGTSTITQQFVKNALLTSDRSFTRKFKELILAIELEFMFNKDQILTMYLNEIPYGNSNAGAEAASKMYFGKSAKDLTLAEAATLTAIPQAPTYYSPYGTHTKELVIRKNYVLDRMVETGKASKEETDKAKTEDTLALGTTLKARHDTMLAPHFAMYTLEKIADQYGEEKVQKEGLKIITTLDYEKQKMAEQSVTEGVPKITKYGASNAAMVAVDPKTGQVLAMVGSKDYFDIGIDGNVNVADSLRQPGSSFKPFSYATAFKKKEYSPSKIIFDLTTDFGGGYIPHNYNNRSNGPVTMRQALSNSLNVPAVKVMSLAGLDNVIRTATDMGITSLTDRDRYGLSLALGAAEVRPVEMAGAFGVFATGGVKQDINPILKITDSNGKTIYDYETEKNKGSEVLDPQIAYEISSILSDNNARSLVFGTRSALNFPERTVAAKTGTTSDFKDAWTVGYTPSIAVAVWVGNSNATKMSSGADGSIVAAPMFHNFIDKALANVPNEAFTRPEGIQDVEVEKWSNKLPGDNSPDRVRDIFAAWQVPKEKDDVHVKVRICKVNGKLAPKDLPETLSEEKLFTNIRSERPDNPNWENPVIAWAQANGMYGAPPTESCDAKDTTPTLSFSSPLSGATVSESVTISVTPSTSPRMIKVDYFLDNIGIGSGDPSSPSFTLVHPLGDLSGSHTLTAIGTDENGTTVQISQNIVVSAISSVSVGSITKTSATITWTTSLQSTSQVLYGISSNNLDKESDFIQGLMLLHTATIPKITDAGLLPNTKYYYKVKSIDGNNNTKISDVKDFTTLP